MKKFLSVLLTIIMIISFTACSNSNSQSTIVDSTQTENQQTPQQSQQPQQSQDMTPAFDRIFDTWDNEGLCQELLQMFALCAYEDWSYDNEEALLNCGKGTGFPEYINTLYRYDTGENLIDSNGYANIDDLVKYALKYFDVNENTVRKDFEKHPNYNSADGTILFDGGIGCVTGVNYIEVTQQAEDEITYYVIDYAISEPEDPRFKYSKLTYTKNDDGSFKFISNKHYGTEYSPSYDLHQLSQREAIEISKDGRYRLHYGNGFGGGDSSSREVFLCDAENGNCISFGIIIINHVSDAGFFSNGDAYTMDYTGLNVYSTSETNSNKCDLIFTTKTNFPGGVTVDSGPYSRYIFAVRRDPVTYEYIVIYGDCIYSDPANDFQLKENYKVGILDKEGNLKQSWDTGIPIMFTVMGFESVYMTKPSETEIEVFVQYKTEERLRGKFNLETGVYTPIKEFKPW